MKIDLRLSADRHHPRRRALGLIAAASILAKVERDAMIRAWDPVYPVYGLAANKGYYTRKHASSLREFGPSPLHRQSFAPVWMNSASQELLAFMREDDDAPADAEAASAEDSQEAAEVAVEQADVVHAETAEGDS